MASVIRPIDLEKTRGQYRSASPFPFFRIDDFLEPAFLSAVVNAYPTYEEARLIGREFQAVNEKLKTQVTDSSLFPAPVKQLADELNGASFLSDLEYITGIPGLLADPDFGGGGMHLTNKSGRLDVHVDFNLHSEKQVFRRLNILLYLNPKWDDSWGGRIEFWDENVTQAHQSFSPALNRCVVFETSETSYHGVTPITCPDGVVRKSFAAYYYTKEAPPGWDGKVHSTVFRARPNETFRGSVLMPMEAAQRSLVSHLARAKRYLKSLVN
jgi:hypothetical protein